MTFGVLGGNEMGVKRGLKWSFYGVKRGISPALGSGFCHLIILNHRLTLMKASGDEQRTCGASSSDGRGRCFVSSARM
jgi:hypothetical protein